MLGLERLELALAPPVPDGFAQTYAGLVSAVGRREPLQHLVGSTGFRYLTLLVEPGVFVPRPETEVVAQAAIDEARAQERPLVVDLCCGAGGIAVAVATEVPHGDGPCGRPVAARRSRSPGGTPSSTARRTSRSSTATSLDLGLLRALDGTVDVLVANPPYIPPDAEPVDPEVRDHDPDLALYGGGLDGLEVPRAVIAAAARLLRPGGLLVMEHAEVQDAAARAAALATGAFEQIESRDDLTGRPRMLVARRNSHPLVTDSAP